MGKLTAVSIEGMKIWFWSKDHNPSLSREARWPMGVSCFLLGRRRRANVSAPMGKVLSRADRRVLTEKVIQHRDEIFREWEEKVQQ